MQRKIIYFLISLLVLILVFDRYLDSLTISNIKRLISNVDPLGLGFFLCFSLAMSLFRVLRFRLLLNFSGVKPGMFPLFLVVLVRNFCSDLLPARIGSLIYVFLVNKRLGVELDRAASSFSLALVFDICSVAPLILVAAAFFGGSTDLSLPVIITAALLLLFISFLILTLTPAFFHVSAGLVARLERFPKREQVSDFLRKVLADIKRVRDAGLYARIFIYSVLIRFFKYAGLYFMLFSLLRPQGYGLADLPWSKVIFGLVVPEFAASLPFAGIAGFGAYQGAWIFTFELLNFPSEIARASAFSHQILAQLYALLTGFIAALLLYLVRFRAPRP